jgi:hypothetical protein
MSERERAPGTQKEAGPSGTTTHLSTGGTSVAGSSRIRNRSSWVVLTAVVRSYTSRMWEPPNGTSSPAALLGW